MREIRFRAWDKINEIMCPVLIIDFATEQYWLGGNADGVIHFKDAELLEITGLKDKNGTEIYEGDILRAIKNCLTKEGEIIKAVKFEDGCFLSDDVALKISVDSFQPEIIGNIYENPELLESGYDTTRNQ